MCDYMKATCAQCPFRLDVRPYLTPERGEELAYATENPWNTFPCHKTTVSVEDENGESDRIESEGTKQCAGFLTMQAHHDSMLIPDGFKPQYDLCYNDSMEMIEVYDSPEKFHD